MKKILLLLIFVSVNIFAQKTEGELINVTSEAAKKAVDTSYVGWKKAGNFVLLFNQSAFNNEWLGGGTSNVAGNAGLNYDFNYKTPEMIWDNKFIAAYGLTKLKDQPTTKSDDRLEFTSLIGKKAKGYWFYSGFLNFKTQMDSGFLQETDAVTNVTTYTKISHFFSPAYLQAGPGMLWKKSDNLKVNLAPATSRLIFVHKHFTEFGSAFGVDQGKTSRFEFGAAVNAYYKFNIMENVSMENILNLYSNYLDNPQNVDIDYQMNLVMKINKYISTNVAFQAIYDDNAIGAFQIREVFGLGFNYGF
ncbi:hypothetical protein SY27_11790 [Flavobacterium sp. 316]|uniref:DUF3078 domain-containing protein n=1 Tax=Flavobacterium sediminilitoris TaxID=2024526 RepID=A0ABY4HTH2_9FLAO|nr:MULTISPECIES: DUF3078 domain-containing protein [Flavobacterium]KIX20584.1 hypothetical protein SY27_11790 [Flavobacterium sp. 316]UOX34854.1 DUF3078 domain-containing protein [Flavobacterium sediminilitoris]